jgi:hypothetical protein
LLDEQYTYIYVCHIYFEKKLKQKETYKMAKIWPIATHTSPRVRPSGDGLSCDIGGGNKSKESARGER